MNSQGAVFIVDDRPDEIRTLGALLHDSGYEVHVATSGERALEAIPEAQPDLIMVDLQLPDIDRLTGGARCTPCRRRCTKPCRRSPKRSPGWRSASSTRTPPGAPTPGSWRTRSAKSWLPPLDR